MTASRCLFCDERVDVPMQPLVRIEAFRLLARARCASDATCDAACEALESAVAEAVVAGYRWMEMLALRDMVVMRKDEPSVDRTYVRLRLARAVCAVRTPPAELSKVLGIDVEALLHEAGAP